MKKTAKFKALQQDWYKRIKESGFDDIEYFRNGEPGEWLKGNSKFASEEAGLAMEPKEVVEAEQMYNSTFDYYDSARALLHAPNAFESSIHELVWKLHSEGLSFRKIGKEVGFSHPKVMRIVDKYRQFHFNIHKT